MFRPSLFKQIVQVISTFFANSRPSVSNFKSFSQSLDQFFLTVGQNNFGNKIPFLKLNYSSQDTVGWLGFWSQIVACGTALISGHVADKLIGHFKMVLLILLSISTFSFIWMCFICTQVIPFSIGKYLSTTFVPEFFSSCLTSNNIHERNYMRLDV